MNSAKPLLNNRDIRHGIQFALNWDKVIQIVLRGDGRRLAPWADSHGDFAHPSVTSRVHSIDSALAAFGRAGFTQRGSDGILRNSAGQRLAFTLTFGSPAYADVPPILREDALKAGVELNIEQLDPTAAFLKSLQKNHEMYFGGWSGGAEFAPRFWEFFHGSNAPTPNTNNTTATAIPELDRLIEQYDRSTNKEEMVRLAHQMIEIVHNDAAYAPGFVQPFIRWGNWRWMKFPEWVNVREAQYAAQYGVHWIDEEARAETRAARSAGETFDRVDRVDERWKNR
jgi:microcin C transport system substrate-binding protein